MSKIGILVIACIVLVLVFALLSSAFNDTNYHVMCYSDGVIIYEHDISVNVNTYRELDTGNVVVLSDESCVFVEVP